MNNGDLNDMLGRVLQNPEALSGIMKLAQGLKNNGEQNSAPAPQAQNSQQSQQLQPSENTTDTQDVPAGNFRELAGPQLSRLFNHDENRTRLLIALKPYLGKNRREKVDYIMNILQLMELAGTANLFNLLPPRN